MFSVELKFTTDTFEKWFYNMYRSRFVEIGTLKKQKYEKNPPIDWSQTKCVTYSFKYGLVFRSVRLANNDFL